VAQEIAESALVLVRLDHVARFIVNANHGVMEATLYLSALGAASFSRLSPCEGLSSLITFWPKCREIRRRIIARVYRAAVDRRAKSDISEANIENFRKAARKGVPA
jgi:hypothetical protein